MSAAVHRTKQTFSKTKFLTLPTERQHKKCCELLRRAYDSLRKELIPSLDHYNELQEWLDLPQLSSPTTAKLIADRFHFHLQHTSQGIKEHRLLPTISKQDRPIGAPPLAVAIYLDNIRSAHNIGSIVRTTEAMRLGVLHFSERMAFVNHKQVQDAAMQCDQWVECHHGTPLNTLPTPIFCLETAPEALSIHDCIFPSSFTLVVGNEEYGCSDNSLQHANYLIHIPLCGRKNSLNVANAYAIAAAEIRRQQTCSEIVW